jgi:biotin carboxyl carrier protein
MYKVKVNNNSDFSFEKKENKWQLNGKEVAFDMIENSKTSFHVLKDNKSFNVEIVNHNPAEKTFQLKINQTIYNVSVKDKYDELLHQLGLDKTLSNKLTNIKAPMPGMVLNILVAEGAEVKKGDALIMLEAMKMENILKAPADAKVKSIAVKKGIAVEKNQVLIEFA